MVTIYAKLRKKQFVAKMATKYTKFNKGQFVAKLTKKYASQVTKMATEYAKLC